MAFLSNLALHFDMCSETFRLHSFLFSYAGPAGGQPAAFHSRNATLDSQQRWDRKASFMWCLPWGGLEDFTWGIVEEEIETIALLTIKRSASISSMEE